MAPTPVDIKFSIKRGGGGKLKGKFCKNPPGKEEEVEFDNVNSDGLIVSFTLTDDDGTGLRFPDQLARAIWVHPVKDKQDDCPDKQVSWSGFEPIAVSNGNRTLQVRNPNTCAQLFKFSLNLTKSPTDANAPLERWDPIGSNRNGGLLADAPPSLTTGVVLALGGALIAVVGAAVLMRPKA